MGQCPRCSREIEASFRFCPWCAAPQRRKLVEFFAGHPDMPADRAKAVRASAYLADDVRHLRLSIWNDRGRAEAAVSLDVREARRLSSFIDDAMAPSAGRAGEETEQLGRLRD